MRKICLEPDYLGCKFEINLANGMHQGGGQLFIQKFLSDPDIRALLTPTNTIMEMCCGYGGMGYYLANKFNLEKAIFIDIDPEVEEGIESNKSLVNFDTEFYLSSAFKSYYGSKVDLIVLNPPHVTTEEEYLRCQENSPEYFPIEYDKRLRLILLDEDFKFHTDFCRDVSNFLTDKGQIVFFENEVFIPHQRIKDLLGTEYTYKFIQNRKLDEPEYYMLIAQKIH